MRAVVWTEAFGALVDAPGVSGAHHLGARSRFIAAPRVEICAKHDPASISGQQTGRINIMLFEFLGRFDVPTRSGDRRGNAGLNRFSAVLLRHWCITIHHCRNVSGFGEHH